jgi:hypothetical protein
MRILVDRFMYQGLHYVPSRHAAQVSPGATPLQDQVENGSRYLCREQIAYGTGREDRQPLQVVREAFAH